MLSYRLTHSNENRYNFFDFDKVEVSPLLIASESINRIDR